MFIPSHLLQGRAKLCLADAEHWFRKLRPPRLTLSNKHMFPHDITIMPDQRPLACPFTIAHIAICLSLHIHSFLHQRRQGNSTYFLNSTGQGKLCLADVEHRCRFRAVTQVFVATAEAAKADTFQQTPSARL